MFKVGDLVYYVDRHEGKHYCKIKLIDNLGGVRVWGFWTSSIKEVNNTFGRMGFMPIGKVFLEKSVKKEIKPYGISKFMDKINGKI